MIRKQVTANGEQLWLINALTIEELLADLENIPNDAFVEGEYNGQGNALVFSLPSDTDKEERLAFAKKADGEVIHERSSQT